MGKDKRSLAVETGKSTGGAPRRVWPAAAMLDAERADLVRRYVPLVGGQLKRFLAACCRRVSRQSWDDLFQEGCLGLIQAALRFDPVAGISFPTFAIPRIQSAISKSLAKMDEFPPVASEGTLRGAAAPACKTDVEDGQADWRSDERRREQIERAVGQAASAIDPRWNRKPGGGMIEPHSRLRELIVDRLLTGDADYRRSLSSIVRATGATYARVFGYATDLRLTARRILSADPALCVLLNVDRDADSPGEGAAEVRHDPSRPRRRRVSAEVKLAGKRLRQRRYLARRRACAASDPGVPTRKTRGKTRISRHCG